MCKTEESRVQIQINLLKTFLKSGGQLCLLEEYWTQMGIAISHFASIVDFIWNPAHISGSVFVAYFVSYPGSLYW